VTNSKGKLSKIRKLGREAFGHTLDKCRFEGFVSDILILFFFAEILQGIDG
jgi:hypothetical protein